MIASDVFFVEKRKEALEGLEKVKAKKKEEE